jgi:hypothetical protein
VGNALQVTRLLQRLTGVKRRVDPADLFQSNHPIPGQPEER